MKILHICLVCRKNNIQGVTEWHQLRTTLPSIRRVKKWRVFQQFNIYEVIPRKRLKLSLTDGSKTLRKTFCRRTFQRDVWRCSSSSFTVILWSNTDSATTHHLRNSRTKNLKHNFNNQAKLARNTCAQAFLSEKYKTKCQKCTLTALSKILVLTLWRRNYYYYFFILAHLYIKCE